MGKDLVLLAGSTSLDVVCNPVVLKQAYPWR